MRGGGGLITAVLLMVTAFFAGRGIGHLAYTAPGSHWDQQAYIWQRVWTRDHAQALADSRTLFSSLRILTLQLHPQQGWRKARIDTDLLRQDGRPLWLVVRLDGQLATLEQQQIPLQIQQQIALWQAAGLNLIGVEIDYDAATAHLPAYRQFLQQLRQQLPASLQLSITALPTWLGSPVLSSLLSQVDSSVLQLHAVLSPKQGIFDAEQALNWSHRYSQVTRRPFRVALPAYSMGLAVDADQQFMVESEAPLRLSASAFQELFVPPQKMADFLTRLKSLSLPHLQGIIWFRLPLKQDQRAWSLATLQAVIHQQPLTPEWQVDFLPQGVPAADSSQLYDLVLFNRRAVDAPLPQSIEIHADHCLAADALGNYRWYNNNQQLRFVLTSVQQLQSNQRYALGWLRCVNVQPGATHVTP